MFPYFFPSLVDNTDFFVIKLELDYSWNSFIFRQVENAM